MTRAPLAAGAAAILAIVIGGGIFLTRPGPPETGAQPTPPVASPSAPTSPSPSGPAPSEPPALVLQRTTQDGCDTIGISYRTVMFFIQPDKQTGPMVWAMANTGQRLNVFWTAGFRGVGGDEPVVLGLRGEVVARDGTILQTPVGPYPRLAGYFVCLAPDALYVQEWDPQ